MNKRCYGCQGDSVNVVAVRGDVLILEREDGFKFPLHKNYLETHEINLEARPADPAISKSTDRMEARSAGGVLRKKAAQSQPGNAIHHDKAQGSLF